MLRAHSVLDVAEHTPSSISTFSRADYPRRRYYAAPAVGDRAVVDDRAEFRGHDVADLVGVVARLLAVEVRLEAMTDVMEEDPAITGGKHDGERAGGRFDRPLQEHGLARRLLREHLWRMRREYRMPMRPPPPQRAVWRLTVSLREAPDVEAHERLHVAGDPASLETIITCFSSSMKLTSTREMLAS